MAGWRALGRSRSATSAGWEDDPGIEGDDPLWRGEQRVDVDLGDARLLGHELAEPDQQRGEHVEVDRLAAANAT